MVGRARSALARGIAQAFTGLILVTCAAWNAAPARAQEAIPAEAAEMINNIRQKLDACGEEGMLANPGMQRVSMSGQKNRPPVVWNDKLAQVAAGHARAMADQNFFDHVDPAGRTVGHRASESGYRWRVVGENLAAGHESISEAMRGWLLSTGHCRNLIDERFTEFGVAKVSSNNPMDPYGSYWVLVMGRPRANDVAAR